MHEIIRRSSGFIAFLIIWAALSAGAVHAAGFTPIDKDRADGILRGITREKYPDADVVQADSHQWISYRTDGTYGEWFETYVKILTEKGKRRYKMVTSSYSRHYNTTEFLLVEVIRGDGTRVKVDIEKNSSDMVEQSQMEKNIYDPDSKVLSVSIPELGIGDTVHFIMHDEIIKARMAGTFSDYILLEGTDPIKHARYTVTAPKEKPLVSIALKSEIPGTVTSSRTASGDEIIYSWEAADVPQAFEEPQMPESYTQMQRLLVSTIPDWETVSAWYWRLCRKNIGDTSGEMEDTVRRITEGITDPAKKMEAVFYWVSQEIRYLGIVLEKEAPGYEPHPVRTTFDRRSGVCRDKAALLVAMLRLAGFEAYPVLIMNGPKKDPEVPQPFFNHAVSCVRNSDGTYVLMDSTDENTKQLFPAYLNNQSYLVAREKGDTLHTSPVIPADQNMMVIKTEAALTASGDLKASTRMVFEGYNDNAYRGYFSQITPDERRKFFEKIVMKTAPGGMIRSFELLPADMLDTSQTLEARIGFEVRSWTIRGKDTCTLPPLFFGRSVGMSNILIGKMGLKKRKYPYVTDVACGISESVRIDLGATASTPVSLPVYETIESSGVSWKTSLGMKDGCYTVDQGFRMKIPEYSPAEYLQLQDNLRKIERYNRKMPVFAVAASTKPGQGADWYARYRPDALILDETHDYEVKDGSSWKETRHVKMKVLTYSGKKDFSDFRIAYNPSWDKVTVSEAFVTSPSGVRTRINDKEINVMDADWVGGARRYPASKIMVVSLPGVEEGSIIDYTVRIERTGRSFFSIHGEPCLLDHERTRNRSVDIHDLVGMGGVLRYSIPIERKTVTIRAPAAMQLRIAPLEQGAEGSEAASRNGIIHMKSMRKGPGMTFEISAARVPPVRMEDNLPPWYSFTPMILASSGSWKDYAGETGRHLADAASDNRELRRITLDLLKDVSNSSDRIRAVRDHVAKNVRMVDSSWHDLPLTTITGADRVLSDGYGNSADRAVVLYAMLQAAGFSPEIVLASWVPDVEELRRPLADYPAPHWIDEVLVRVRDGEGTVYLNDTDQYAALGTTSYAGHPCLVVPAGDLDTVRPASDRFAERTDTDISIRLSRDGGVVMKQRRTYYGTGFASFSRKYSEMRPEERKRQFEQIVSSISLSAKPVGDYITVYDRYPGYEELTVQVDAYAVRQDGFLYLKVPGLITTVEGVSNNERSNPLFHPAPRKVRYRAEITLPEETLSCEVLPYERQSMPIGDNGSITSHSQTENSGKQGRPENVSIIQELDTRPGIIPIEKYPDLFETQRLLSHPQAGLIMLKMKENWNPFMK